MDRKISYPTVSYDRGDGAVVLVERVAQQAAYCRCLQCEKAFLSDDALETVCDACDSAFAVEGGA